MNIYFALRILYIVTLLVTCSVAFWKGGRTERLGALIILIGSGLTIWVEQAHMFDWRHERTGLVIVDLMVLVAFFALALQTNRFWPLWATAFHLIAVATHLIIFIQPPRVLQAYAIIQGFWAYPMLAAILIGSLGAWPLHRRATAPQG